MYTPIHKAVTKLVKSNTRALAGYIAQTQENKEACASSAQLLEKASNFTDENLMRNYLQ